MFGAAGRGGFGINRRTWQLGRAVGNTLKRAYDGVRSARASTRPKKRVKTGEVSKGHFKEGVVYNQGTGGQYSSFTMKPGKDYLPRHVTDTVAPLHYQTNTASQLKSIVGAQNASVPISVFYPDSVTTADAISRIMCYSATADVTMNNIYLSNAYVIIYDIVCRNDCAVNANNGPLAAWQQGDADEGGSASTTFIKLGTQPWESEIFNQYFEIKQVTRVVLAAGGTHVHKISMKPKKVVSQARATYSGKGIRGLTYFCMVEVHGAPANDTTTQTSVSIGVAGLNIVVDKLEIYKKLAVQTPTLTLNNTLPASFAVAEQVVNMGGSTITTNAEG